ncbi:MAG: hypothetical protein WAM94_01105 [Chromatiaceae bacterium]
MFNPNIDHIVAPALRVVIRFAAEVTVQQIDNVVRHQREQRAPGFPRQILEPMNLPFRLLNIPTASDCHTQPRINLECLFGDRSFGLQMHARWIQYRSC